MTRALAFFYLGVMLATAGLLSPYIIALYRTAQTLGAL